MGKSFDIELKELRPKLLALTRKFCRCAHLDSEPEDIVQDVLFKLWKTWQSGTEIKNSEAWAVRATKNACISCWRKKSATAFSRLSGKACTHDNLQNAEETASGTSPAAGLEEDDASAILKRTLDSFSESTRKLLCLRSAGVSLDEISAITGRSKGSVKSSISAARKILIQRLNS